MLVSLEIKNFLLIKKISINFIDGFNAFTGETGAGKSIIIEGLKLVLGGKNQTTLNLKENEISTIKAIFEINDLIKKNLIEQKIDIDDDYLIVEREINSKQKSKLFDMSKWSIFAATTWSNSRTDGFNLNSLNLIDRFCRHCALK